MANCLGSINDCIISSVVQDSLGILHPLRNSDFPARSRLRHACISERSSVLCRVLGLSPQRCLRHPILGTTQLGILVGTKFAGACLFRGSIELCGRARRYIVMPSNKPPFMSVGNVMVFVHSNVAEVYILGNLFREASYMGHTKVEWPFPLIDTVTQIDWMLVVTHLLAFKRSTSTGFVELYGECAMRLELRQVVRWGLRVLAVAAQTPLYWLV
ncbi:hypothetical protein BDW22DRAFT_1342878 [Trametopsis cervina]|nr:hypothetical protein BDW22DRAFT_1342878 [Trametopsis cervina]